MLKPMVGRAKYIRWTEHPMCASSIHVHNYSNMEKTHL